MSGLLSTLSACEDDDPPVDPARVVTRSGPVRGSVTHSVRVFQGRPPYEPSRPYTQSLVPGTGGIKPVDFSAEHPCDFWLAPPFEQ
ncbi:hypothetical protein [Myxococcus stipitatus]|uniref:hypothetical protein n=1 Tax=Myxococcus stipitatus TaxID=83455 RepID=UPI0030CCEDE6